MFSSFSFHEIDVTCMEILCDQKAFLRKTSYLFSNKDHFKLKGRSPNRLIHRKYTRHMLKKNKYGRNVRDMLLGKT